MKWIIAPSKFMGWWYAVRELGLQRSEFHLLSSGHDAEGARMRPEDTVIVGWQVGHIDHHLLEAVARNFLRAGP